MIPKEYLIAGRLAIVTGADTGVGRQAALALAEAGADVVAVGHSNEETAATATAVRELGRRSLAFAIDLPREDEFAAIADKVAAEFGGIDMLVNADDFCIAKPLLEMTAAEWRLVLDSNINGLFVYTKAVIKYMRQRGKGKIIHFTSGLAERGVINGAAYGAAKAAAAAFTRSLALEFADDRIHANAIGLGWFTEGASDPGPEQHRPLAHFNPMRRLGRPEDLAGLVVYLASDASDYVTGQVILADGSQIWHG